ncbi:MAG TPA: hypothetical protein VN577_23950 [Terriglobales bacterium]|nr:hypothetical protein [Terriglobales bacterium]
MFLLFYFASLGLLLLFLAGAARVNDRADEWADSLFEYLQWRESSRAA